MATGSDAHADPLQRMWVKFVVPKCHRHHTLCWPHSLTWGGARLLGVPFLSMSHLSVTPQNTPATAHRPGHIQPTQVLAQEPLQSSPGLSPGPVCWRSKGPSANIADHLGCAAPLTQPWGHRSVSPRLPRANILARGHVETEARRRMCWLQSKWGLVDRASRICSGTFS